MPFALIIIGAILAVSAFRNTYSDLGKLVVGDLTGSNSFLVWIGAIGIIGAIGYVPQLQSPSRALLALILLAMFLANGGFWDKFVGALKGASADTTPIKPEPQLQGNPTININSSGGSKGGGSDILGSALQVGGVLLAPETGGASLVATSGLMASGVV